MLPTHSFLNPHRVLSVGSAIRRSIEVVNLNLDGQQDPREPEQRDSRAPHHEMAAVSADTPLHAPDQAST